MTIYEGVVAGVKDGLSDPRLLAEWFAVGWSREVAAGGILARRILGLDLVLWRSAHENADGLHCWLDLCVHRGADNYRSSRRHHCCGEKRVRKTRRV